MLTTLVVAVVSVGLAAGSGPAAEVMTAAVLAIVVAHVLVTVGRPRQAVLLAGAGLLTLLGQVTPLSEGTATSRSIAVAVLPLALPLAGLSLFTRAGVAAAVVLAGGLLAGPAHSLFYDPLRDLDCVACGSGAFTVWPDNDIAARLALGGSVLVVAGTLLAASTDRALTLGAVAALAAWSATGYERPHGVVLVAVLGAIWLATGSGLVSATRVVAARRRLGRLAAGLTSTDGPEHLVRRAFGNPSMRLLFPLTDGGQNVLVDAAGRQVEEPGAGWLRTLVGDGAAVLVHDRPFRTWAPWPPGPELLLGLSCARLDALLAVHEAELASSRARLVARADAEARSLERDLHDGAQQHLLALGVELQLSRADADEGSRARLDQALADVDRCLDGLRDISHGIYPPTLIVSGLTPALAALGRTEGLHLGSLRMPSGRFADLVERTAYLVVLEVARHATAPVDVLGEVQDGTLRMSISGPAPRPDSLVYDRVAAIGGKVESSPTEVVVSIPCA